MIWGFITSNIKWIVIGLITCVLLWSAWQVKGAFSERAALLKEREGRITSLVQDLTIAETETQALRQAQADMKANAERVLKLAEQTVATQKQIRAEISDQKKIFEDHDIQRLVNARPGLIEIRANKKTEQRFNELSDAFNH